MNASSRFRRPSVDRAALALVLLAAQAAPLRAQTSEIARWRSEAARVTIVRDDWGIAHVTGRSDADAVFGLMYAQAEDDFNRVENNFLDAMGLFALAEGESRIWHDLRARLFVDPDTLRALYRTSPAWLRRLMDAWADGLNFYLYRHPEVHPRVITRFQPWMALSFTEGSIGPDLEQVNLQQLQAFYGGEPAPLGASGGEDGAETPPDPAGSNGIAIGPSNTVDHHALLLINPHTSFYFRSEVQATSGAGLNVYGAVTWGQFFVYQGFNDRVGWIHTSSGVDAVDQYLETVTMRGGRPYYRYGGAELPMTASRVAIRYRTADGGTAERRFTVWRTRHGPVIARSGERWVTISLMNDPVHALIESWSRTKARNLDEFRRTVAMRTNSSNNTVYADADGHIAYFQASFIPRRDTAFDFTRPVDGSDPATAWQGLLPMDSIPQVTDPASGWIYNSNDAPWWAAGPDSPKRSDYPRYVDNGAWSARGRHAWRVLQGRHDFSLAALTQAAFDGYLTWFERPVPALLAAFDALPDTAPLRARLAGPAAALRAWDLRWSVASVPTTLAVFWGENIARRAARAARGRGMLAEDYIASASSPGELLEALAAAVDTLTARFGTWQVAWGDINRFQRLSDDIAPVFSDSAPSIPVGFTAGQWGSLAAFGARAYPGTRKRYGSSGNSFVAVVEFGDRVRARAVTAGGESGDPRSPHFNDEAGRYASGDLREVYFYPSQLAGHTERTYHPGE